MTDQRILAALIASPALVVLAYALTVLYSQRNRGAMPFLEAFERAFVPLMLFTLGISAASCLFAFTRWLVA